MGPVTGTRAALAPAVLADGVVAAGSRRSWAHAVDGALVAAALAVGVLVVRLAGASAAAAWIAGAITAAAVGAVMTITLARVGRTPGRRWLGLRTVERSTVMPQGLGGLAPGRTLTADTRLGRDPLRVVPARATAMADDGGHWRARSGAGRGIVRLLADDGTSFQVSAPTVIGRSPVAPEGMYGTAGTDGMEGTALALLAVPDLTRTISKSHALLEPDVTCLWVTDLGSTNGTAVAAAGARFTALGKGVRTAVPFGARVAFGDRLVRVGSVPGTGEKGTA